MGWWSQLLAQVGRVRDRRLLETLHGLGGVLARLIKGERLAAFIRERLATAVAAVDAALAEPPPTPAIVDDLESALASIGARRRDTRLDDSSPRVREPRRRRRPHGLRRRAPRASGTTRRADPDAARGAAPSPREKKLVSGLRKAITGELAGVVRDARSSVASTRAAPSIRAASRSPSCGASPVIPRGARSAISRARDRRPPRRDARAAQVRLRSGGRGAGRRARRAARELIAGRERALTELRVIVLYPDHRPAISRCSPLSRAAAAHRLVLRRSTRLWLSVPARPTRSARSHVARGARCSTVSTRSASRSSRGGLAGLEAMIGAARARAIELAWKTASVRLVRGTSVYERAIITLAAGATRRSTASWPSSPRL